MFYDSSCLNYHIILFIDHLTTNIFIISNIDFMLIIYLLESEIINESQ